MKNEKEQKVSFCVRISTPWWVYLICAVLFLLAYGCAFLLPEGAWYKELSTNLGYGIFASTLVALLIDVGNTKAEIKKDRSVFDMLNAQLRDECENLPSELYTSVYECCGYNFEKKLTYHAWLEMLFPETLSEKHEEEIRYFLQQVDTIRIVALQLQESIKAHFGNTYITAEYLKQLSSLIIWCKSINQSSKRNQFSRVKELLDNEIQRAICNLYPSLENDFTREYNGGNYM